MVVVWRCHEDKYCTFAVCGMHLSENVSNSIPMNGKLKLKCQLTMKVTLRQEKYKGLDWAN